MRRRLIYSLALALILSLACADALAGKRSRGSRKSARVSAKKEKRAKSARIQVAKRGRKEVSRRGRRGRGRDRIAGRSRRRRHVARSQSVNRPSESQTTDATQSVRTVAPGIPAERVAEIQAALIRLGHLEGPASGQYDERTVDAMKQFQQANKLPATGLPSAHTLKRLGVAKRSSDGYAVPVKSVAEGEKKPS